MKRFILLLTFIASVFIVTDLKAQKPSVAIVHSDDLVNAQDVQSKLQNTAFFNVVDLIDANSATPSLTTLQGYDAVLAYTNFTPFDQFALGDSLAAYIEGGGGVVGATFFNITTWRIAGAFETNYQLLGTVPDGSNITGSSLGMNIDMSDHPVLTGVSSFNGGTSSFHSDNPPILNGAVTVASWEDGNPLVVAAENIGPGNVRRVDLNFWPASSDIRSDLWDSTTDGDIILGNALLWVAGYDRPGTNNVLTSGTGTISDGSNQFDYINYETASWLISPGAQSVTLDFTFIEMEDCCDYVRVYDGPDNLSPLLGEVNGQESLGEITLPQTFTSTGGSMFVEFTSNLSVSYAGWEANYSSTFLSASTVLSELTGGILKQWTLVQSGLAVGLGPLPESYDWWSVGDEGAIAFADIPCGVDDIFTFNSSGIVNFDSNNTIYLDPESAGGWNDALGPNQCHDETEPGLFTAFDDSDVSAFGNGGSYMFTYNQANGILTIDGDGFYITYTGKTNNGDNPFPVPTKDFIISQIGGGTMQLLMPVNGGESYWTFNFQEFSAPEPPGSFLTYAMSSSEIILEWEDVNFETGYIIDISTDNLVWTTIPTVNADVTSYTDTGLSPNTNYYYRISSLNGQGQSANITDENVTFSTSLTTNFNYNNTYGGSGLDYSEGIAVDDQGNYYVFGRYNNQIDLGGNILNTGNTVNQNSLFLVKYDVDGNVLWARSIDADDTVVPRDVTVAPDNSVYLTGYFWGNMTFGGNTITSTPETASLYLLKYDLNGNEIWSRTVSSTWYTVGNQVDTDDSGNVYVAGYLPDEGATFASNTVSGRGGSLFKWDQDGNEVWFAHAPTNTTGSGVTEFIGMHISDAIYITGDNYATTDFGNGVTASVGDEGDLFVVKYDFNGNAQWVRTGGGSDDYDVGRDVTTDVNGDVYVAGWFRSAEFNASGASTIFNNGPGNTDIIVMKYDTDGNIQWANGSGNSPNDHPYSITSDGENVYVTGYKSKLPVSFGGISVDNGSLFLAKYQPNGTVESVEKAEGEIWGYDLEYFNGLIYLSGNFEYYANFGTFQTQSNNLSRDFHTATLTVGTTGELIAHWPIGVAEGINDVSGFGNDLSNDGTNLGASVINRFNIVNEALGFTGSNYALAASTNHPQGDASFSYSFWEYHTVEGDVRATCFDIGNGEFQIRIDHFSGNMEIESSSFGNVFSDNTVSGAFKDRWNHIVVTKNDSELKVYINGVLSVTEGSFSTNITSSDIFVGDNAVQDTPFIGRMDDIRIYNYAISNSQVQTLFDEGVDTSVPIVRLEPSLATADDQVRLIYNAERGNKALMGLQNEDVHIHTGVITSDPNSFVWEFVKDNTFANNSIGLMAPVNGETNQYEITLGPTVRDYYGVPDDGTPIYKLAMVFRNAGADLVGNGTPEFGAFPGGYITTNAEQTDGDIYMTIINPTPLELDSLALVALYNALGGESWVDNSNWLSGPIDTWAGVTVSGGRVTEVFLDGNNLTGQLPSAIGSLSACQEFSVTGNNISGNIPTSIGNMSSLQWLYLDANQLSGNIPVEISNLSNLNGLYLNENQLTGTIPSVIGNLTGLTDLSLYTNQLTGGIPSSFQNLVNLFYLDLEDNNLTGPIPSYIGTNMSGLAFLWLSENSFTGSIPTSLGNLGNLEALYLGTNELTGSIPIELGNLTSLSNLDLGSNNLTGEIPVELGNLFNLEVLNLSDNILTGAIPSSFSSLSFLTYLYLNDNLLDDMVDLSSTSIMELDLTYNKFTMEDLLINLGVPSGGYYYDPQQLVGEPQTRFVGSGTDYTFDLGFDTNVTGSTYTWYLNDNVFVQNSSSSIFIPSITTSSAGTWYVEIENTSLPGLILQTEDIVLNVQNICASQPDFSDDTRIDRVVFSDLDNTSDLTQCASYTNFTQYSATIYPGQSVNVGITMGTCGGDFSKMAVFYIDWNQDGSFDDTTERVLWTTNSTSITEFQTGTYDVPTDAAFGTYLMRVIAQETTTLDDIAGCGNSGVYEYGETEDYTVNVVDGSTDLNIELVDVTPNSIFNSTTPIEAGSDINVTTTVGNSGLVDVLDLVRGVGYFLSDDQTPDTGDIEIGTSVITTLAGGDIITLTDEVVTIPTSIAEGSYYLIVAADPDQVTGDPDLSDNFDVSPLPIHVLSGDSEPPVVSLQSPPSTYTMGTGGVTISAEVTDDVGVDFVLLAYGRISEITDDFDQDQYEVIIPEEITPGIYSHTLSDADFDDIGVQYYFGAGDAAGNIGLSDPLPAKISVEFPEGDIRLSDPQPVSNSSDPQETDYRIFSVPVRNATIGSVLGVSSTDKEQWRVWQYNGGNSELSSTGSSLSAGKGYWLIYLGESDVDLNFGGVAVDASNSNPFVINLVSGINLIGNPYRFPISWQQVIDHNINEGIIADGDVSGLTFYRGGFSSAGNTTLGSTEGAFIQSNEPFTLEIPFSAQTTRVGSNFRTVRNSLDKERWEVGINLSNETTFYNVATVGMDPEAEDGQDMHDQRAMPYLFNYLEFNSRNDLFSNRISGDIVSTSENHIWEYEATTSFDPSEAILGWDNTYFGDNDRELYLYDVAEERIVNMREQQDYHFYLKDKRNFKIIYGSEEFIESALTPKRFTLGHAYPNPFTNMARIPFSLSDESGVYKVRMTVYNSVGELVKVLADEEFASGFYSLDWNGTNRNGQQVSEGLYIYKLSITDENGSKDLTGKLIFGR